MNRPSQYDVGGAGSLGDGGRRLLITDPGFMQYDPNSRLASAITQDPVTGKMTVPLTGGWGNTDPRQGVVLMWPVKDTEGLTPNELMNYVVEVIMHEIDVPLLGFTGDTYVTAGVCVYGNPAGTWPARSFGMRYDSASAARRARLTNITAAGVHTATDASTSLPTVRKFREAFLRSGINQALYSFGIPLLDGTGSPIGSFAAGTPALLELGKEAQLAVFIAFGRNNAANVNADTVYMQLDTQDVRPFSAAPGLLDGSDVINIFPVGDSTTLGTGWNPGGLGALFGWRYLMEIKAMNDADNFGIPRYFGGVAGSNAYMKFGRGQHEGHSGFTTAQIDTAFAGYLATLTEPIDYLPLLLMTNDAQSAVADASVLASMQSIINKARAHVMTQNAVIGIGNIQTLSNVTHEAKAQSYRVNVVPNLTGHDGVIDLVTGYIVGTMSGDGVHPNDIGYQLFADRIYDFGKAHIV